MLPSQASSKACSGILVGGVIKSNFKSSFRVQYISYSFSIYVK